MSAALQLVLPAVEEDDERPAGAFVQVLPGAVTQFCSEHGLDFDERALLEHLLDIADRATGVVRRCTLSGLARDLGLGPSGRRTLAARVDRLVEVGAVEWRPGQPGHIAVLVYRQLVRSGRGDRRAGYVQVVPAALDAAVARHDLDASARALLRRLLVDVDHRTRASRGSLRHLTAHYGLGRGRITAALCQLAAAGLVRQLADRVEIPAYEQLVRVAGAEDPPRPNRAGAAPESRAPRVQIARPTSLSDGEDQDLEPEQPSNAPAPCSDRPQGQGGSSTIPTEHSTLAALALALPTCARDELLSDPSQAPGRQALRRRLETLAATLGESEAVATIARDWPDRVDSPMALANNRAQRRLDEALQAAGTTVAVAELAQREAAKRRESALRGAANLGQVYAGAGYTADDVAESYPADQEARDRALAAFYAVTGGAVQLEARPEQPPEARRPAGRRPPSHWRRGGSGGPRRR